MSGTWVVGHSSGALGHLITGVQNCFCRMEVGQWEVPVMDVGPCMSCVLTRFRMQKEAMMAAQSAFAGGEDPQMQWALAESQVT